MKYNFDYCFSQVIKSEGGYSNDLNESGGPTKHVRTGADLRRYKRDATMQDIKDLSVSRAKDIYKFRYWDSLHCDDLSSGVDYTVFDYGINSGIGRPRKALQRFKSLSGISLINAINNERTAFLKSLVTNQPKDNKFLRGWLNRVERVRQDSLKLARDNITGPSTGIGISAIGASIALCIQHHPIEISLLFVSLGLTIGYIIHKLRNK